MNISYLYLNSWSDECDQPLSLHCKLETAKETMTNSAEAASITPRNTQLTTPKENVLCIQQAFTQKHFNPGTNFVSATPEIISDLNSMTMYFREREETESNEAYKQIIPYNVIKAGKRYLVYNRGKDGGEKRLSGKFSLGIGGHVNDKDLTIKKSIYRELTEEIGNVLYERNAINEFARVSNKDIIGFFCKGFIYDDSTDVGRVHLGLLILHEADTIFSPGGELEEFNQWYRWMTDEEIAANLYGVLEGFENWSLIVYKNMLKL